MQLFPASCCCHICTESKGHFTQITRRKQSFSLIFSDFVACSVEICVLPGPLMCSVLEQQEFYFIWGPKLDTSTGKYQGSYIFIALEWAVFKPFSGQAALQSFCAGVDFMEGGKKSSWGWNVVQSHNHIFTSVHYPTYYILTETRPRWWCVLCAQRKTKRGLQRIHCFLNRSGATSAPCGRTENDRSHFEPWRKFQQRMSFLNFKLMLHFFHFFCLLWKHGTKAFKTAHSFMYNDIRARS